ncbi:MAG: LysM peptidoglycan-binding domain-containing protein [Candidatus Nealsonbacteria bacterium]|nr:LysM peptidoglycan-binding domain-containing protein [Candidatus Nealsonbacteria bacterium]
MIHRFQGSGQDPLLYLGGLAAFLLVLTLFLPEPVGQAVFSAGLTQPSSQNNSSHYLALGPSAGILQLPDFYLIQKNSLKAVLPTGIVKPQVLATLSGTEEELEGRRGGVIEYTVAENDTLSSIAQQFNISLETVLWANNLNKNSVISAGKKLVILPVSGVMYVVGPGDTLSDIVKKYKGNLNETIAFNELTNENEVFAGDIVIVPHGLLPSPAIKKPTSTWAPLTAGYFICPIGAPCRVTQGLHWYNAIDFSRGQCGEPIYAAAAGRVQKVKLTTSTSRWAFGGAGNHITILHPNGVVTFYGHLLSAIVDPGDEVSQGQIIAYMGGGRGMAGAGLSTGCHVHFQVVGAKNPFTR